MSQPHNPFSTSAVRPGAIPYFADDKFIDNTILRWQRAGWLGQLVGPHGVGKTTLAMSMVSRITSQFDVVKRVTIRSAGNLGWRTECNVTGESTFRNPQAPDSAGDHELKNDRDPTELWIVDGIERINRLQRWLMVRYCRHHQIGLLVSSHRRLIGIPSLATLTPSPETFCKVAIHLLVNSPCRTDIKKKFDIATFLQAYEEADGNLREALMLLYDRFETFQQSRNMAAAG